MQTELLAVDGLDVGLNRIKRLRRKNGLRCVQKKKFKATTDSKHKMPIAPNLLEQDFDVATSGQVRVDLVDGMLCPSNFPTSLCIQGKLSLKNLQ